VKELELWRYHIVGIREGRRSIFSGCCDRARTHWKTRTCSYNNTSAVPAKVVPCIRPRVVTMTCMQPTRIVDMGSRSMSPKLPSDAPRSFGRIPSTRTWGRNMLVARSMTTNRVFWKGAMCSEGRFARGNAVGWWRGQWRRETSL